MSDFEVTKKQLQKNDEKLFGRRYNQARNTDGTENNYYEKEFVHSCSQS